MKSKKPTLFRDHPEGLQLHAGHFRKGNHTVWHSDDGGRHWWSGYIFGHDAKVTRKELISMAESILRDLKGKPT